MTIYNSNVDLVNDNVHTTFDHSNAIRSQDIEQKLNSDVKSRAITVANLLKMRIYNPQVDLVNDNVYTKFGLSKSICWQKYLTKTEFRCQSRVVTLKQICEKGRFTIQT